METTVWLEKIHDLIRMQPMRVVVEEYPQTMQILSGYGFDLCCGGGHTIEEAAQLHGFDPATVVNAVTDAILAGRA